MLSGVLANRRFVHHHQPYHFKNDGVRAAGGVLRSSTTPTRTTSRRKRNETSIIQRTITSSSSPTKAAQAIKPGTPSSSSSSSSSFLSRLRASLHSPTWRRVAIIVRYTRIPVLVASVYSLGYQQGVIDCTKTPEQLSQQILQSILMSVGVTKLDDDDIVQIVNEKDINFLSPSQHHQVASVGHRIISSARIYVQEQLQKAMDEVKDTLPVDVSEHEALVQYNISENVQFWQNARLRLQGEKVENHPWDYIFISPKNSGPNAFVTEILPQRFFITTQMLQITTNPDELAIVLGHEISHLILGHVSQTNMFETALRTIEVLLLSIDPTSGALALMVIGTLAATRKALSAAHSRENEYQADELGMIIAARACYDTANGCQVIRKMHDYKIALTDGKIEKNQPALRHGVMDTHPPTLDRFYRMQKASTVENYHKYKDTQCCDGLATRLVNAAKMWGSSSGGENNNNNNSTSINK